MLEDSGRSHFTNWLEKHTASVIKVARAYTLNGEECQDLVQEILLQAWRSFPRFQGESSPATWFYRVALNTAMNWRRHEHPRRRHQKPMLDPLAVPAHELAHTEQVEQRETVERLYKAIHQLPDADIAVVLLYLDDMSYREMASVLGISESNVGAKLTRARKALAELMNEPLVTSEVR